MQRKIRGETKDEMAERTRELELALRRLKEQNASLEEFVYIASHDLQEPVRTITGYLQLIEDRYGDKLDGDGREFIDFALGGASHLQSLIEGLLVFSRFMSAERAHQRFLVSEVVEAALLGLTHLVEHESAQVEFDRDCDTWAMGDEVLISQVLQNLIDNGIKFSESPARIRIGCDVNDDGDVEISVSDEGVGFAQSHAQRIFKIFRRLDRDTPGSGVGLSVCRQIVERHDGRIWAESEPGVGTTVTFSLPRIGA